MATASIIYFELTILDNIILAIASNLSKQNKRANIEKIYNELIKMLGSKNASKEHLPDKITELIIQGKIMNKPNRSDDLYHVDESILIFE